jgi:hypothetical protein
LVEFLLVRRLKEEDHNRFRPMDGTLKDGESPFEIPVQRRIARYRYKRMMSKSEENDSSGATKERLVSGMHGLVRGRFDESIVLLHEFSHLVAQSGELEKNRFGV